MTTKMEVFETLFRQASAYATTRRCPYLCFIAEMWQRFGTEALAGEIAAKCGGAVDAGAVPDYIDKELLALKATRILAARPEDQAAVAQELAAWELSPEDKAYAADFVRKVVLVHRD
jgi:hypothetical protein